MITHFVRLDATEKRKMLEVDVGVDRGIEFTTFLVSWEEL